MADSGVREMVMAGHPDVPRLRGWSHQWALVAAVPLGAFLVVTATPGSARIAAAVFAASLVAMYGASTVYHRVAATPRGILMARRVDHGMIFVLIAGSYTPMLVLALPRSVGVPALIAVWATALAGIVMKVTRINAGNRVGSWLYHALGWLAVVLLPSLVAGLGWGRVAVLGLSGVLYSAGASFLLWRPRDLVPGVFGYHELWHAFVVAASACHFALVVTLV